MVGATRQWPAWTLVANRHDGRWGMTIPDPRDEIPVDRVNIVHWYDGPQGYDLVQNNDLRAVMEEDE